MNEGWDVHETLATGGNFIFSYSYDWIYEYIIKVDIQLEEK